MRNWHFPVQQNCKLRSARGRPRLSLPQSTPKLNSVSQNLLNALHGNLPLKQINHESDGPSTLKACFTLLPNIPSSDFLSPGCCLLLAIHQPPIIRPPALSLTHPPPLPHYQSIHYLGSVLCTPNQHAFEENYYIALRVPAPPAKPNGVFALYFWMPTVYLLPQSNTCKWPGWLSSMLTVVGAGFRF